MTTLTSKFDLGEEVWTIRGNKAVKFTIETISIMKGSSFEMINVHSSKFSVSENDAFKSKEELIEYLFRDDE